MSDRIKKLSDLVLEGKLYPEPTKVEFDREDIFLTETQMDAKRIYEYVVGQQPVLTEYSALTGYFRFDGSVPGDHVSTLGLKNVRELLDKFYAKPVDNLVTFEWQHCVADFEKAIHKGVSGLIKEIEESMQVHSGDEEKIEFLKALKTVAEALIAWAHKCSDEAYKLAQTVEKEEYRNNLFMLSEALKKVPEFEAESFYEAVLSIYVFYCYAPDSVGLIDRTLYDYYKNDIKSGKLTREQAKEYLQELFIMLQSRTPKWSDRFTKGGESHFSIGGYLPNGEDGFNELSELILEALMELPTYIPQVTLRWTKKLPYEKFKMVLDYERKDKNKRIAFANDDTRMKGYKKLHNMAFEDACTHSNCGCNEVAFPGGFVAGGVQCNIMRSMETVFFKRTEEIIGAKTFEEFFEIYKKELLADIDTTLGYVDNFNMVRARSTSYVSSLMFEGSIEKAIPFNKGAVKLATSGFGSIGVINSIDCLTIVKQFVFEDKLVDMKTLTDALSKNWEGFEELHALILKKGRFFGNNDEMSNKITALFGDTITEHLSGKRTAEGYTLGHISLQGYNPHSNWFGSKTKATPDGRYDGDVLKFSIGQNDGYDREGMGALLASIAVANKHDLTGVTNIFLDEQLVKKDEYFDKLVMQLEAYFKMGGSHFQLNHVSKDELIKAKKTPEDYKSLRVRVSGFADYFVNLPDGVQDEVISRTEQRS